MPVRLRANVDASSERTKEYRKMMSGEASPDADVPLPAWLEISAEYDAFFLFYYDADGTMMADGWHVSLEHAKRQAAFELGITESEWRPVQG
jgi:hypothetical protein